MRRAALAVMLAACGGLDRIEPNTCGNGVREDGEDCDSYAEDGFTCIPFDQPHGCHFQAPCPPGYVPDFAGACRFSDGVFDESMTIADVGTGFQLADLDGDQFPDLIVHSAAAIDVYYGDGAGHFFDAIVFPATNPGAPIVGHLATAASIDLLFHFDDQLVQLESDGSHQLRAVASPSDDLGESHVQPPTVLAMRVDGSPFSRLVAIGPDGAAAAIAVEDWLDPNAPVATFPEKSTEILTGSRANVDIAAGKDGDELAVGFPGLTDVEVVSIDATADPAQVVLRGTATFPFALSARPLFADVDGDGRVDLVATQSILAGEPHVGVALGNGDGTFQPGVEATTQFGTSGGVGVPVEAVDLDGDGIADYAVCTETHELVVGLAREGALATATVVGSCATLALVHTAIGDFNRDGRLDLAVSTGASLVTIIYGGDGFTSSIVVPTQGLPSSLQAGDFDGDRIDDLAIQLDAPTGGDDSSTNIDIVYGVTDGEPAAPLRIASFVDSSVSIESAILPPGPHGGDNTGDLVVTLAGEKPNHLARLLGRAGHTMVSPFTVDETVGAPVVAFGAHDGLPDFTVFSSEGKLSLATEQADHSLLFQDLVGTNGFPMCGGDDKARSCITMLPPISDPAVGTQPLLATDDNSLFAGRLDGNLLTGMPIAVGANPSIIGVADFFGDRQRDAWVHSDTGFSLVLGVDEDGGGVRQTIALPMGPKQALSMAVPISLGSPDTPTEELVVSDGSNLDIAQLDTTMAYTISQPVSGAPINGSITQIAVGDVNRDGAEDILYSDDSGVHVLLGQVKDPDVSDQPVTTN